MKAVEFWRFVNRPDRPVILLIVTSTSGATPGKTGFRMAADAEGGLVGSIGGGKLEYDLVEEARALLRMTSPAPLLRHLHLVEEGTPEANGMLCGGEQTVLLYPVRDEDRPVIDEIISALSSGASGLWSVTGTGMHWQEEGPASARAEQEGPAGLFYQERIFPRETLFIIGGGHVSLALSRAMSLLDWRLVLLDDRPEVDTMKNNHWADEKIIAPFAEVAHHVSPGGRSWVVIMTPSHRADEEVLRRLVAHPFRYLGMMASPAKAAEILSRLRAEGVEEALLRRVFTPVGLPISSHTPAEIAVSIAAQLIQIRNQTPTHEQETTGSKGL
ncbi:MAG TPA: XdhC family protein [bacterium]|nr:XdhC family protein [bacterium]